jgi:hypothetical protein
MKTLALATILALGLLAAPLDAEAQSAGKTSRIGYLSPDSSGHRLELQFARGLRGLGWAEGQNTVIEGRYLVSA